MADDKHSDSREESDESTPLTPTGAELADDDLPERALDDSDATAPELTDGEIGDDNPDGTYVDDPATEDINEAKLDRATDEVAAESTVNPGSTSSRRPRASRPVRRSSAGSEAVEPELDEDADDVAESDAEPAGSSVATRTRTVAKKDRPTASRKTRTDVETRTTPQKFVGESVGELRKVVWPTLNQVQQYFIVVLVFVLFIIAFVSLLDLGFGWALLKIFG